MSDRQSQETTAVAVVSEKLDQAILALELIQGGPADPAFNTDNQWSAGVAMSALEAIRELDLYPEQCDIPGFALDPYTMGLALCDPDGIVRRGRFHKGIDYPCTGHAHFAREHIKCLSLAHNSDRAQAVAPKDSPGGTGIRTTE